MRTRRERKTKREREDEREGLQNDERRQKDEKRTERRFCLLCAKALCRAERVEGRCHANRSGLHGHGGRQCVEERRGA